MSGPYTYARLREIEKALGKRLLVNISSQRSRTKDVVYIGRGSEFGNPYVIGRDGSRDDVCDKFERLAVSTDMCERIKAEHKGKTLGCFCRPKRCHGLFLAIVANE